MAKDTRTYWYSYVDIKKILDKKSEDGVFYHVEDSASQDGAHALQTVSKALATLKLNSEQPAAVIPINLGIIRYGVYHGSHWVGLVIRRNPETNNLEAFYNDSLGTPMEAFLPNLRQILRNHGIPNERIRDFHAAQQDQDNDYDCGAWTVLNLDSLARTGRLPAATVNDVIAQRMEEFGYVHVDGGQTEQSKKEFHSKEETKEEEECHTHYKPYPVVTNQDRYEIEGDDSSDEEVEHAIYHNPLIAERYNVLNTKLKGVKLLEHHATRLKATDQKAIEDVITQIQAVKGFCTEKGKISHAKAVKAQVETVLAVPVGAAPQNAAVKKAVLAAYHGCKSKDLGELNDQAVRSFLGLEALSVQGAQAAEAPLLDLKWAFLFQDLGIRLLISNKVRELYFPNKAALLGRFDNLPTDEMIHETFQNVVRTTLKKHKKLIDPILQHESYNSLVDALLSSKRALFSLLKPISKLSDSLDTLLQTMEGLVSKQPEPLASMQGLGDRRVETIIKHLEQIDGFVTLNKKKVSHDKKVKSSVEAQLQQNISNPRHVQAVKEAYSELGGNKTILDLTTLAKQKLIQQRAEAKEEEPDSGLDLISNLQDAITEHKGKLLHPVLPDSTSFSPRNITDNGHYSGVETLFSYLRLVHCSAKRFIKNAKSREDFDGAAFSRGWQFDPEKKLAVIETQLLSAGHTLTSKVMYPYNDSSYAFLYHKLEDLKIKAEITDTDIVNGIKSILKTGKVPAELHINETFERFLTVLTYHLFGTEVERHPAAAIHNIMALDLVQTKGFYWAFKHLPMAIEAATPVARGIQNLLHKKLALPYYYDNSNTNTAAPEAEAFQDFIMLEQELVSTWLESRGLAPELTDAALAEINNLCFEYYGIRLTGAETTYSQ